MRVVLFSDSWPWFGDHSGYGQLARHVASLHHHVDRVEGRHGLLPRLAGSLRAAARREWWRLGSRHPASEARYERWRRAHPDAVHHLLYGETHHAYLARWEQAPANLIATLHHPPEQHDRFHPALRQHLSRLRSAIVLYRRDAARFERWIGKGRVYFAPHGVDVDFFRPLDASAPDGRPRIVYVGAHGRNTERFVRLARALLSEHPQLRLDLVVPKERARLWRLIGRPQVRWHQGISDADLRGLYQRARLLLLPLSTAAANNAVIEALACGLPVVVNRQAGDPDYGAGSAYPLPTDKGDDAMLALVERYLDDPAWAREVGRSCRTFAETHLAWPVVARRHLDVYAEVAKTRTP